LLSLQITRLPVLDGVVMGAGLNDQAVRASDDADRLERRTATAQVECPPKHSLERFGK
jgi:hypothetical protein